jgi:hypothetical protein
MVSLRHALPNQKDLSDNQDTFMGETRNVFLIDENATLFILPVTLAAHEFLYSLNPF